MDVTIRNALHADLEPLVALLKKKGNQPAVCRSREAAGSDS
jgi:hypothetical protein